MNDYDWALDFLRWQPIPSTAERVWENKQTQETRNEKPPKDWNLAGAVVDEMNNDFETPLVYLSIGTINNEKVCAFEYPSRFNITVGKGDTWVDAIISAARKAVEVRGV